MHVLGHIHEGGQMAAERLTPFVDRAGEDRSPSIVGQQGKAVVARERQFVNVARLMKMSNSLSMWLKSRHCRPLPVIGRLLNRCFIEPSGGMASRRARLAGRRSARWHLR